MKQPDTLNHVAKFHTTFKHPVLSSPTIPTKERCDLRIALLSEELKELEEAIKNNNIIEIADALCDLQYVLTGAVLEFGLGEKFYELFNEVQRSNMSKTCGSETEALATIEYYKNNKNTECYYVQENDVWLVYRKDDHKTIKSINYSPANLKDLL
jgi:predicted HAD superfamily Cof-like phosphohydrolase